MKRNWIKWIALGLTVGMLGIMVPAVAHAEEATDSVMTEEVQMCIRDRYTTSSAKISTVFKLSHYAFCRYRKYYF